VVITTFASVIQLGVRSRFGEQTWGSKTVEYNRIGSSQTFKAFDRNESRVTRACAHEKHLAKSFTVVQGRVTLLVCHLVVHVS
jgi:hypothetical protein